MEEVSSFKCLGTSFTTTGHAFGEIKACINVARAAFSPRSGRAWKSRVARKAAFTSQWSGLSCLTAAIAGPYALRISAVSQFLTTAASTVSPVVGGVTASCAKFYVITSAPPPSHAPATPAPMVRTRCRRNHLGRHRPGATFALTPEAGWSAEDLIYHAEGGPRSDEQPRRLRPPTEETRGAISGSHLCAETPSLVRGKS